LARKYEEKYSTLDLAALGHSTPLAAATALLWDVLRVVDSSDEANPVLGVDDAVALTPRPGMLGCWPSLYCALCEIAREHGEKGQHGERGLLLSQLKPLLLRHWHAGFDESGLGFLSADGAFSRLRKMKHLVHDVLKWRHQRLAWRQARSLRPTQVDEAVSTHLELVASKSHNDLVLRCKDAAALTPTATPFKAATAAEAALAGARSPSAAEPRGNGRASRPSISSWADAADTDDDEPVSQDRGQGVSELRLEIELLRAENAALRSRNRRLGSDREQIGCRRPTAKPTTPVAPESGLMADIFDDPFEPPPEASPWKASEQMWRCGSVSNAGFSTAAGSDAGALDTSSEAWGSETCATPALSLADCFEQLRSGAPSVSVSGRATPGLASGAVTPAHAAAFAQKGYTFMPMWFTMVPSAPQFSVIPRGIVRNIRAQFEPSERSDPDL
jgi:hypothetical protein